jgi:hypothetical protein
MQATVYCYQAYGLNIQSPLPLPELKAGVVDQADVVINFGHLPEPPLANGVDNHRHWSAGQDIYLHWDELGTFRIRQGCEITVDPAPQIDDIRLRPPILGACMAVLLHQRGYLVLHASAIVLPTGAAVAFIGDKGWGKSTMAATLHQRGSSFLTDDILAIALPPTAPPFVVPAFPQIKLWPSAISALGSDPETLPRLIPQLSKRQQLISAGLCKTSVPLQALYLLGKGPKILIKPLKSFQVLGTLFRHSYGGRFGKALLQHGEAAHFLQCMNLIQKVPVHTLQRPSDLSLLPDVAQAVEQHGREIATI